MKLIIVEDNLVIRELIDSVIGDLADAVAEGGDASEAVATPQEGSAINPTFSYNSTFPIKERYNDVYCQNSSSGTLCLVTERYDDPGHFAALCHCAV